MKLAVTGTLVLLMATVGAFADAPGVQTLSDAELYIKARMVEIGKEKEAAIAKAREDIERRVTLDYQAKLAELKRQLIEAQAKAADLEAKVADLTGILQTGQAAAPVPPTPSEWGKPVFAEDFQRDDISDKWDKESLEPGGSTFKVVEGRLTGKEQIATVQRFSGKAVRVEYDTWTLAESPCDASVYFMNPDQDFRAFAGVGGNMNRDCKLIVNDKGLGLKNGPAIVRGRTQRVVAECGRGKMRLELDGQTVLNYEGADAPQKLDNVQIALYTFAPGMNFDNVKVYVIP